MQFISYFYIINIFVILIFITLLFLTRRTNKRWSKINDYLGKVATTVESIRYGNLTTKIEKIDHPTYKNVTESINRMVETLNDREKMIVEYQTELMRQNKLLESVINSLSDGIIIINEKSDILRATPQILTWFGEKPQNIIGKNITQYIDFSEKDSSIEDLHNSQITIKNLPEKFFIAGSQILSPTEKKRHVIIIKDITTEKEIERLKEDFVATLTHDLKVPIVAASNIIDLMLDNKFGEISEKQEFALNSMKASNNELLTLVQTVLDTYKIKKSGIIPEKEIFNLKDFIINIIKEMQPLADKSGINIIYKKQTQNEKIFADKFLLSRVIKNLISNAIYHSNTKGQIEIITSEIKDFLTISVIDFGKGIPPEEQKMIFNQYYSTAKKMRKVGTGLGLYLSRQIALAHNGEITITSTENVQTEFCVKIPK